MSYSLATPRRRPRRRSSCLRSVWWLIEREAAWQVLCRRQSQIKAPWTRRGFAAAPRYVVRGLAERMIEYRPERRFV